MEVYEAATKRRSIRRYKDKQVSYDILEKCVNAGRLAPSGRNNQVLEYVIINDEQMLPRMYDNIGGSIKLPPEKGGPLPANRPKAYILVLINTELEAEAGAPRPGIMCEVGMASENIILAAQENGIGVCPVMMFNADEMKRILQIPDKYEVAIVMTLGYPDESPVAEESTGSVEVWVDSQGVRHVPKRRLKDIAHHNKF
jgi:nitroreductase